MPTKVGFEQYKLDTDQPDMSYSTYRSKISRFNKKIKKKTVELDKDGNVKRQWIQTQTNNDLVYQEWLDKIDQIQPRPLDSRPHDETYQDTTLVVPLYDMHFGKASLEDYRLILDQLVNFLSIHRRKVVFVIGQDLFHWDNFRGMTASGTQLSAGLLQKENYEDALSFWVHAIENTNANEIEIIYSMGNHDESISYGFVRELRAYFRLHDHITFDVELEEYKARNIYNTTVVFTHGDKAKMDAKGVLAIQYLFKQLTVATTQTDIIMGHLHHKNVTDLPAVRVITQNSACPTDKWHKDHLFVGAPEVFSVYEYTTWGRIAEYYIHRTKEG